ncbi:ABC transporter permease [Chitinophaga nivalis]|uniref:ABC transporter permease n=1 Tax=Chitinophaga nivalis TaxID=2991709 RepID=A0ABT3IVZ7_9BACT|nr:ABC transporter permease [Chitinophaga nivalis]MCW3462194.1 ABC transporter permease [Chitinophaga nivalis]MCW3488114.1 ABC transporter permease [Chitinophaga nivalis]
MWLNYLKIAWRNLRKQKVFAFVNMIGMSVALCAALLLSLTAYQQWSYDNFHENRDHIYQVYEEEYKANRIAKSMSVPDPLADVLRKEVAGVKYVTRVSNDNLPVRYGNNHYYFDIQMVDNDYLKMFTFPFVKGDPQNALQQLNQVVLTEKTAASLFRNEDPVGKTIEVNLQGKWRPFIVSGVAAALPDNSSISFEMLTRFENIPMYAELKNRWNESGYPVFMQLEPNVTTAAFDRQIKPLVHKYFAENIAELKKNGGVPDKNGELLVLKTISLNDFHLTPGNTYYSGLNQFYPWLMLILAFMITAIACINFINLSVARSFTRSNEVGLRKALGAQDKQLIFQFWSEAFLLCCFAFVISILLTCILLPHYNRIFRHRLTLGLFQHGWLLLSIVVGFFTITLLAGGYPAWKVSRLNIISVLKGKQNFSSSNGMQRSLIVVQFVVAIVLISCTVIIGQQLKFVQSAPLGFNSTQVISIPVDNAPVTAVTAMRSKLLMESEVTGVTAGQFNLGLGKDGSSGRWMRSFDYKGHSVGTQCIEVDYDYASTLDLKMVAGRDFSRDFGADTTCVVINELMAKQLGEADPIGSLIEMDDRRPLRVIGVVKNYHYESLHKKIEPLTISLAKPVDLSYIFVKVNTANPAVTIKKIEGMWKTLNPLSENAPSFLDENTDRLYRQEKRFSKIFINGAVLAVLISCMGLFAIAVLVMAQRKKEIGIRKVLGASVGSIVMLLAKDFLRLVIIAVIIATPAAWYFMQRWLKGFEFHVNIHWWVFAMTGAIALIIAFLTVSMQTVKAALANPIKSLNRD